MSERRRVLIGLVSLLAGSGMVFYEIRRGRVTDQYGEGSYSARRFLRMMEFVLGGILIVFGARILFNALLPPADPS